MLFMINMLHSFFVLGKRSFETKSGGYKEGWRSHCSWWWMGWVCYLKYETNIDRKIVKSDKKAGISSTVIWPRKWRFSLGNPNPGIQIKDASENPKYTQLDFFFFLAHLSWKLKWANLIAFCPSSDCPSVCPSVCLSVCL
jgi:hypothetical protein